MRHHQQISVATSKNLQAELTNLAQATLQMQMCLNHFLPYPLPTQTITRILRAISVNSLFVTLFPIQRKFKTMHQKMQGVFCDCRLLTRHSLSTAYVCTFILQTSTNSTKHGNACNYHCFQTKKAAEKQSTFAETYCHCLELFLQINSVEKIWMLVSTVLCLNPFFVLH